MIGLGLMLFLFVGMTPPAATPAPPTLARQHFERGMQHYDLGEFKAAIEEFKTAYSLSAAPGLLFNLAQASRLDRQYEAALHLYRSYLREQPDAPNRVDVEQRIRELVPVVRAAQVTRPPPASPAVTPAAPAMRPGREDRLLWRHSGRRLAGIVVGSLGLSALATGIGFGVAALSAQRQLSRVTAERAAWTAQNQALYTSGQRDANLATAMYVIGGAAIATGTLLYALDWMHEGGRWALAPLPGGAQVGWACDF